MISVCIATYNGERFIREQMASILAQLSAEDEVIVSDDGSTDRTLEYIRAFRSPIVRIVQNRGEHGYTPNFENALREAKGDYIFLSDQDDVWKPEKVKTCLEYLKKYSLVISDADIVDREGKLLFNSFFEMRHSHRGFLPNLVRFSFLGCCLAFRRELRDKALPFPPNHYMSTHDNWITMVGMTFFRVKVTDEKLVSYRRHDANASSGGFQHTTTLGFKIRYRLYLIKWLLRRAKQRKMPVA